MVAGNDHHVKLLRESAVIDHRRDNLPGLITLMGVRYTTARATAAHAIDAIFRLRGDRSFAESRSGDTPIAGGAIANKENFLKSVLVRDVGGVALETVRRLALTYCTQYDAVLQIARGQPDAVMPIGRQCAVTGIEILHAVHNECAVKLTDAVIRRTEAGAAGHPGADAIRNAAAIMAKAMGWDEWKMQTEIAEVEAFYRLPV
jgi:glycerol-3-phosphate dehydrogenase